jgi:hypothetical protein
MMSALSRHPAATPTRGTVLKSPPATLALGLMFYVEIFDDYSGDQGFSREDMTMTLLGHGFSVLRNSGSGLREIFDFRMEYLPSGYKGFDPLSDYAGQNFFLR